MKPLTQEWISKAEQDYQVALFLSDSGLPVYDAICFHAQQSAEKFLKAWLTEQGVEFPRIHDLEILARMGLPTLADLSALMDGLRFLTAFAVEVRYPGFGAEKEDATRCLEVAERLRALIRQHLSG